MNIEKAKGIALSEIIEKMDQLPQQITASKIKYFSPYRNERTPSFFVFRKTNRWFDFGDNRGGDGIDIVRLYLESQGVLSDVSAALRWLDNMTTYIRITPVISKDYKTEDKGLVLKKVSDIQERGLINYASRRGISPSILQQYFKQVRVKNNLSGKSFYALGMKNETNGYELRNDFVKGCVKTKDISFIRGIIPKPSVIHVFEGMMDFASVVAQREGRRFEDDVIILHSLNCLDIASSFIRNYGYRICCTWMDNDLSGKKATSAWETFCRTQEKLTHVPMNRLYKPYKDVNAAHMAKLSLK